MRCCQIPRCAKTGIFLCNFNGLKGKFPEPERTGNFFAGTGNFLGETGNSVSLIGFMEKHVAVIPGSPQVRVGPMLRQAWNPYRPVWFRAAFAALGRRNDGTRCQPVGWAKSPPAAIMLAPTMLAILPTLSNHETGPRGHGAKRAPLPTLQKAIGLMGTVLRAMLEVLDRALVLLGGGAGLEAL
jgi:hypothetical protein